MANMGMTRAGAIKPRVLMVCFVVAALAWAALLGWDNEYQVDPVTKVASGPYAAWQVATLGVIVAGLAFWAGWQRAMLAIIVIPIALVLGFVISVFATGEEQDGLFMVGALLLLIGSGMGTAVMAAIGAAVRGARAKSV